MAFRRTLPRRVGIRPRARWKRSLTAWAQLAVIVPDLGAVVVLDGPFIRARSPDDDGRLPARAVQARDLDTHPSGKGS